MVIILDEEATLLPKPDQSNVQPRRPRSPASLIDPPPPYSTSRDDCDTPVAHRFIRALVIGTAIWTVLAFIARAIFYLAFIPSRQRPVVYTPPGWNAATDGVVERCVRVADFTDAGHVVWNHSRTETLFSRTTLDIPLEDALSLSLFSRGNMSWGSLEIDHSDKDTGVISIEVSALDSATATQSSVCVLRHNETHRSIGIYAPGPSEAGFMVVVRLPSGMHRPTDMHSLETDLPSFEHHIGDIAGAVRFRSLSLRTTNGTIQAKSVVVDRLTLQNTAGAIAGAYDVHSSASVHSLFGRISGNFALHTRGTPATPPTALVLHSGTGDVHAHVALSTLARTGRPRYDLNISSPNAGAGLVLAAAPASARVNARVFAPRGPASIALPRGYEGAYLLHARDTPPAIDDHEREDEDDRWSRHRDRSGKGTAHVAQGWALRPPRKLNKEELDEYLGDSSVIFADAAHVKLLV